VVAEGTAHCSSTLYKCAAFCVVSGLTARGIRRAAVRPARKPARVSTIWNLGANGSGKRGEHARRHGADDDLESALAGHRLRQRAGELVEELVYGRPREPL